ncbi:hypothetical protein [Tepidimonas fonticaldi]|nr:hypothetical protein [Tepidimonas fonticaldi]
MTPPAAPSSNAPAPSGDAAWRMAAHWPDLAVALTEQAIDSVDHLLRGLGLLLQRGRLTEAEYRILALPAQRLKQCGVHAQQIVRLQSGQVRQSHEKIDLAYVVESVLQERREALALQGITVRRQFRPVELLIDPTVAYSLVQAMLEWAVQQGSRLELSVEPRVPDDTVPATAEPGPPRGWLAVDVLLDGPRVPESVYADGVLWLLAQQLASTDGGIALQRQVEPGRVRLTAQFRRTVGQVRATDATGHDSGAPSTVFKTIGDSYAVVCSADAPTRLRALDVVKKLGIAADGVASAAQALAALAARDIHLLVLDEAHLPADAAQLADTLAQRRPGIAVVRLVGDTQPGTDQDAAGEHHEAPRIPLEALDARLGPAVMFSLSKVV